RRERRGRPLGRVCLFYVVHEIQPQGPRSARIEGGENAGLPGCRNLRDFTKSGVAKETHGQIAAFGHPSILGRDRGLLDPLLATLHCFVVALLNLREDGSKVVALRERPTGERQSGGAGENALKE